MQLTLDQQLDARPLALTRVLVAVSGLVIALEVSVILRRAAEQAAPVPYLLPGWTLLPGAVEVWTVLALLSSLLLALGLFTRVAALSTALVFALALASEQQVYSNHLTLLVLLSALLACGTAGGAWSLDARRLGRRSTPSWPQVLVMTQVSTVYLFAGLSKINQEYLGGEVLATHLTVPVPGGLLPWLALASVVTELGLAVALWVPRLRILAAGVGLLLHVGIAGSVGDPLVLGGFALLTMSAYPLFLTRPTLLGPRATLTRA